MERRDNRRHHRVHDRLADCVSAGLSECCLCGELVGALLLRGVQILQDLAVEARLGLRLPQLRAVAGDAVELHAPPRDRLTEEWAVDQPESEGEAPAIGMVSSR